MQDIISGRTFNIRVSFDSNGEPILNWVHGMYKESEHITEIKRVSESEHLAIALALGIRHSSVHHSVNRALRGNSNADAQAEEAVNDLLSSMQAVENTQENFCENVEEKACNA